MKKTGLVIIFMIIGIISTTAQQKILIDADTANEVDDIVAIARALKSDKVEIVGLTAAQWNNEHTWMLNTVEESWQLNNQILGLMGREDIPSRIGSEKLVSTRWAGNTIMDLKMNPQLSDASDFIVETALSMPIGEKLTILVLGAITNVASAILQEPAIIEKISVRYIGTLYNFETYAWNKNEFNTRNDLNALDAVFNTPGLELYILPANVVDQLSFRNKSSMARFEGATGIDALILERWKQKVPVPTDDWGWIMWDIGLIHSVINPDWLKKKTVYTPPENLQRPVTVYTWADIDKMKADFWAHFGKEK